MIPAILVLSAIILFHEFGHFLLARLNGVTVLEFSLGFGPRLFSWVSKKSGTRYSVKIFPLGGSCAMLGENGEFDEEEEYGEEIRRRAGGTDADGVSGMESPGTGDWSETGAADTPLVSFYSKSPLARMAIIAAGPIFNFILAFVFAVIIVAWAGHDAPQIVGVSEGLAAEAAGLQAGDVITKLGNRNIYLSRDITLYMMSNRGEDVPVRFERYQEETGTWKTYEVTVRPSEHADETGRHLLGILLSPYRVEADSLPMLLKSGAYEVRFWIFSVIDSLKQLVKGRVNSDDIAGPVRIVTIIDDTVEENKQYGFVTVLMNLFNLMVMFSANLGVMNLLPFPALDGGRLVFLFWEFLTRRPVNQRVENAVNMTGMALLMTFMVFVFFNDIRNLF